MANDETTDFHVKEGSILDTLGKKISNIEWGKNSRMHNPPAPPPPPAEEPPAGDNDPPAASASATNPPPANQPAGQINQTGTAIQGPTVVGGSTGDRGTHPAEDNGTYAELLAYRYPNGIPQGQEEAVRKQLLNEIQSYGWTNPGDVRAFLSRPAQGPKPMTVGEVVATGATAVQLPNSTAENQSSQMERTTMPVKVQDQRRAQDIALINQQAQLNQQAAEQQSLLDKKAISDAAYLATQRRDNAKSEYEKILAEQQQAQQDVKGLSQQKVDQFRVFNDANKPQKFMFLLGEILQTLGGTKQTETLGQRFIQEDIRQQEREIAAKGADANNRLSYLTQKLGNADAARKALDFEQQKVLVDGINQLAAKQTDPVKKQQLQLEADKAVQAANLKWDALKYPNEKVGSVKETKSNIAILERREAVAIYTEAVTSAVEKGLHPGTKEFDDYIHQYSNNRAANIVAAAVKEKQSKDLDAVATAATEGLDVKQTGEEGQPASPASDESKPAVNAGEILSDTGAASGLTPPDVLDTPEKRDAAAKKQYELDLADYQQKLKSYPKDEAARRKQLADDYAKAVKEYGAAKKDVELQQIQENTVAGIEGREPRIIDMPDKPDINDYRYKPGDKPVKPEVPKYEIEPVSKPVPVAIKKPATPASKPAGQPGDGNKKDNPPPPKASDNKAVQRMMTYIPNEKMSQKEREAGAKRFEAEKVSDTTMKEIMNARYSVLVSNSVFNLQGITIDPKTGEIKYPENMIGTSLGDTAGRALKFITGGHYNPETDDLTAAKTYMMLQVAAFAQSLGGVLGQGEYDSWDSRINGAKSAKELVAAAVALRDKAVYNWNQFKKSYPLHAGNVYNASIGY